MSVDAGTAPEALMTVETGPIYAELRERILSGEVKLNFSYLPPRAIGLENLNIDPTKFPLVDPNKPPERIIYL